MFQLSDGNSLEWDHTWQKRTNSRRLVEIGSGAGIRPILDFQEDLWLTLLLLRENNLSIYLDPLVERESVRDSLTFIHIHNERMSLLRVAFLACSVATAICAFVAAWYWYLSSQPSPERTQPPLASIDDNPAEYIMEAQVNIYSIQAALMKASRLNKRAATWSAIAAFLGAIATILTIV